MRLFVTGGSGFIGTNLVADALRRGHEVVNYDWRAPFDPSHHGHWVEGDILEPKSLQAALARAAPDWVIHLAARTDCDEKTTVEAGYRANTDGTRNVLRAATCSGSVRRLVVTSSQYVFQQPHPPESELDFAPRTVYGQSKIETERITRESDIDCHWTIVRPTTVWGPWCMRYIDTLYRALRGGFYLHPGREPVVRSYGFVGNVVDQIFVILSADSALTHGKTLYVGDAPINLLDWVNGFSQALAKRNVPVVPRGVIRPMALLGDVVGAVTRRRFIFDSTRYHSMIEPYLTPMEKTFELLGKPPIPMQQGIRRTVDWLHDFEAGRRSNGR